MPRRWVTGSPDVLRFGSALAARLRPRDVDLVWLPDASWLLWSEVARDGIVVFERRPGAFGAFRSSACLRMMEAGVWKARDARFVQRSLDRRWQVNTELVGHQLAMLARYVGEMESVLGRFGDDPLVHHAAERLLELHVECAAAINTEVAQAVARIPPSDYYTSFLSMSAAGWIDRDLAVSLAECARVRNALVHRYEEIELPALFRLVQDSAPLWRQYVRSVQEHLRDDRRTGYNPAVDPPAGGG